MNHPARAAVCLILAALAGCASQEQTIGIPRTDGIVIDGKADEWGERGYRVEILSSERGPLQPADDLDVRFRLGWDPRGLLVLAFVRDDVLLESEADDRLWERDGVELFLADHLGGEQMAQTIVSPGVDPKHPKLRVTRHNMRQSETLKKTRPLSAEAAAAKTSDGYLVEALLPWAEIGVTPELGRSVAFQLYVNDADGAGGKRKVIWFPRSETHGDTTAMHSIRLAADLSPPCKASAAVDFEHLRDVRIQVVGVAELTGKEVAAVASDGRTLARGTLSAKAGRCEATLRFPVPADGAVPSRVTVRAAGQTVASVELPDLPALRAKAMVEISPHFTRHVLDGEGFPECVFDQPLMVENLIGPHELDVTFYDRQYRPVTKATQPGRYGAVIRIQTADGKVYTRGRTLYRVPKPFKWWEVRLGGRIELPAPLELDVKKVEAQREILMELYKWAGVEMDGRSDAMAILLAGIDETNPEGGLVDRFDDAETKNRQWWVGLNRRLAGTDKTSAAPVVCPRPNDGKPAPVLHEGTMAEAGMTPDAPQKIDAVLTKWAADTDEGFIACVVRNGVVVLHKAYGRRDGKDVATDSASYMASLTKLMHGACLMMLVDRGLVDLDTPVGTYLPQFRGVKNSERMTVRTLFTHTAGMWGHWGDEECDFEYRVAEYAPYLAVAKKHAYNGMSLSLGSKIIEHVSGDSLPRFYKAHLVVPLGMKNTQVTNSSYNAESTAWDMAVFGQMLLNGGAYGDKRFFSEATRDRMLPVKLTMILGEGTKTEWGIGCVWMSQDVFGQRTFGHGSAASATLRIDLDNQLVVSMTRRTAGKNFNKYHPEFLKTVADCMIAPKNLRPPPPKP